LCYKGTTGVIWVRRGPSKPLIACRGYLQTSLKIVGKNTNANHDNVVNVSFGSAEVPMQLAA